MTEFPLVRLQHSLAVRTLLAFTLIVAVMLFSMLAGMGLSDSIRGDAEALNKAGSLRMQAYRLALLTNEAEGQDLSEYITEFENTLKTHSLRAAIGKNTQAVRFQKYAQAERQWRQLMLPLLQQVPPQNSA